MQSRELQNETNILLKINPQISSVFIFILYLTRPYLQDDMQVRSFGLVRSVLDIHRHRHIDLH